jgi:hypothetical protein
MRANEMPDLPMSDAGTTGGNYGKSISAGDLKRGFTNETTTPTGFMDDDGSTYAGDLATRGGFAGRPQGWER